MKNHKHLSILKKQHLFFFLSLFAMLLFSNNTFAQESIIVKGTVYSAYDNEPLEGTSITVKNTIRGVETDKNGNFEIKNLKEGDVLAFYFTSFKTQEIKVNKKNTSLKIYMEEDSDILDPIVLVGDCDVNATYKTKRSFWKRISAIF